jgi:hypothetical protein
MSILTSTRTQPIRTSIQLFQYVPVLESNLEVIYGPKLNSTTKNIKQKQNAVTEINKTLLFSFKTSVIREGDKIDSIVLNL